MGETVVTNIHNKFLRATLLFTIALFAVATLGCGDSRDDFVSINTNNGAATGNLVFNFVRAQGVINVPADTATLDFTFFDGLNQTGNVTLERSEAFNTTVTINNVPSGTQSYRIVARDAAGAPVSQTTDNANVAVGQTSIVDLTQAATIPVTLDAVTATPDGNTVAINGTQLFVLTGTFSNGEALALSDATWTSSNPTVASIDNTSGLATGLQVGDVTITGTRGASADTAALNVTAAPIASTPLDVFVANNGDSNRGEVDLFDTLTNLVDTFNSGANQGLALDTLGNIFQNEDNPADHVHVLSANSPFDDFNPIFDRFFDLTFMGCDDSAAVKGSALAPRLGILMLANFGESSIITLGTAGDGTTPAGETTTPAPPWDIAYHEDTDRAFVAFTDGTVGVYDNFLSGAANVPPDRVIDATELDNAHGISYDPVTDSLVVSDVGAITTGPNNDGQIFVFASASTADGLVTPQAIIGGPNTLLGNPVDIDLQGPDLRVAEKTNDQILIFTQILTSTGGDIPPALATAELKPESIASQVITTPAPDNSDIDGGVTVQNLLVSTNPGTDSEIFRISPTLTGGIIQFDPIIGPDGESVKVDGQGDVFYTEDGGLCHFSRVGNGARDFFGPFFDPAADRQRLSPPDSALKGLDIVESASLIIIADNSATSPGILGLGKYGQTGNAFFTPAPVRPWDVDYDPIADRLFAAFTDGTVAVFDNYLAGDPDMAFPDRIITVTGADNLHGIVHDAANDVLLLSDVGSVTAGPNNDGSLYVINNANTADGNVAPDITLAGPLTNLGNPVDVAYDGTNLFVAEKTNDLIMRFDNIRTSPGGDIAPSATFAVDAPESISLITGLEPLPDFFIP